MQLRPLLFAALLVCPSLLSAAVIGQNPPALPLTAERIAALPADQRPAWQAYFERSEKLRAIDEATLAAEMKAAGLTAPLVPPHGRGVPLRQPAAFWSGPEAARIADIVVSFQTPAGGWNKNTNQTLAPRKPGERFGFESGYVGTIDNDATIDQLNFLAKTITAVGLTSARTAPWRASFARGVEYLFNAQYPNGGWPQVYPLEGSYHDAITYNDNAMTNVMTLLHEIATGAADFAFVPAATRTRAAAAVERGLGCLLATQITVNGRLTVWCQQHDMLTLAPCAARNYEMPSQSGSESAGMIVYLMSLSHPSPAVVKSVHAAAAWLKRTAKYDIAFRPAPDGSGRKLVSSPGAGPIWPRYAEIGSDRPLFGDRDLTIHDNVDEISKERRNGYSWWNDGPKRALDRYTAWAKDHPAR
jgi:PelA/Pel-15E family pectate lyase